MYDLPNPLPAEGPKCLTLKVSGNVDQNITASCRSFSFNSSSEVGFRRAIYIFRFNQSRTYRLIHDHDQCSKISICTMCMYISQVIMYR